ncbi:enoyl-CoA hydratase/isomerase family protein [Rhodococcus artemisiae]|uniref:Enoyl-CoA hydratase-related protein n=1 Tax=Rhodococcus artemisiae TaxID=714159 RepID=A0ABU7LC60_9NOCA|nr:enoyl-CoA hydratase-related protein [Rhodococcus artemisiae]MEE2059145.1 enoyl-CoA hydratase-related protein [Rhodococcus artemisiae]
MNTGTKWSTLALGVSGQVATVKFDRPEHRNGVTTTMVTELHDLLHSVASDSSISVLMLTGAGSTFCPGADLSQSPTAEPSQLPDIEAYQSATLLHEMPQVTVAAINGACAGAGLAWASACDIRLASAGARFSTAFLQVGLAGELGTAWTLTRVVGGAMARDLYLLPRKFGTDDALRIGFVSRVFPDETFAADTTAIIAELASRDPRALRTMKRNFVDAEQLSLRRYVEVESARQLAFFTGEARKDTIRRLTTQRSVLGTAST